MDLPVNEENIQQTLDKLSEDEVCICDMSGLQIHYRTCCKIVIHTTIQSLLYTFHSTFDKWLICRQISIKKNLDAILTRRCHVEAKLQNIGKVLPNVIIIHTEGEKFRDMIARTNKLAENVSAKVRQLDLARVSCRS